MGEMANMSGGKGVSREVWINRAMWPLAVAAAAGASAVSGAMMSGPTSATAVSAGIGGALGGLLWRWRVGAALRRDPQRELARCGVWWGIIGAAFAVFMLWLPHVWPLIRRTASGDTDALYTARHQILHVAALSLAAAGVIGLLCGGTLAGIWQALLQDRENA